MTTTYEFHNNGATLTGSNDFWGMSEAFADNAEALTQKLAVGILEAPERQQLLLRSIPFGLFGELPEGIRKIFTAEEIFPFADDLLDVKDRNGVSQVKHVTTHQLKGLTALAKAVATKAGGPSMG